MLVTISGLPGSGKTTVAQLVSRQLGLPYVYAGDLFRREASRRGLSLEAFGRLAETDESIDRGLDRLLAEEARAGDKVLEGRLAAHWARVQGIPALTVWLEAAESVRAERIAQREGGVATDVLPRMREREASDRRRYQAIYGVDYRDPALYDLPLASDGRTPEAIAAEIVEAVRARCGGTP